MSDAHFEQKLRELTGEFSYPPAPDLVPMVRQRLAARRRPAVAWHRPVAVGLALLLGLLALLLTVPASRAALLDWILVGAVRLDLQPTGTAPLLAEPPAGLGRAVTLAEAEQLSRLPLLLPQNRPAPDQVFWQPLSELPGRGVLVFVWLAASGEPEMSLYTIDAPSYGLKPASLASLVQTHVSEFTAYWIPGPHPFIVDGAGGEPYQLVAGNVLIWTDGDRTYRLETVGTLDSALVTAEALRQWQLHKGENR